VDPHGILFIEGSPFDPVTPWDDPDRLACNAGHWYDTTLLARRTFDPGAFSPRRGVTLSGVEEIAAFWAGELGRRRDFSRDRMGDIPTLIGETGITYDMNGKAAYRDGDYSKQEAALDALYRALDANLLNVTQWNYTADHDHDHGDQWNHEDLSIFSRSDQADPQDLDSGGRAVRGFCRPYVRRAAGTPLSMSFEPESGVFRLEVESDPAVTAPTELYVPRLHYPRGVDADASSGRVEPHPESQSLLWIGHRHHARLELRPIV
jgi:hypothetical protein